MKQAIIILFTFCSILLSAQDSKVVYVNTNYTLLPHNILQGAGYTLGYHWMADQPLSYKAEFGMLTSFRERKMNNLIGEIRYLDLYYNLAQMNLAFIPTWQFLKTKQWELSGGLGFSAAYQSKIFTLYNYEYERYPSGDDWMQVNKVDATAGLLAGLTGNLDLRYQFSGNWLLGLSAQYQVYYQGEQVIVAGIGVGYRF